MQTVALGNIIVLMVRNFILNPDFRVERLGSSSIPHWRFKKKGDGAVSLLPKAGENSAAIFKAAGDVSASAYLRQTHMVEVQKGEVLEFRLHAELDAKHADGRIRLCVFADEALSAELESYRAILTPSKSLFVVRTEPLPPGTFWVFAQIDLPQAPGATLRLKSASLVRGDEQNAKKVHFLTFGDYGKASSRLRAWKLGQWLAEGSAIVTFNGPIPDDVDIVVFQKVMPFKLQAEALQRGKTVVYDFDDHYGLASKGTASNLIAFMDGADLVTVGSEALKEFASAHHPHVHLLENPVDISGSYCRPKTKSLDRVCWFGAPEGRVQLAKAGLGSEVTTITAGGDIEFDIETVDQTLLDFDIAVFPLEITDWNAAKNANRLIKAVSLGLPVLASATSEHWRVAEQLGLDDKYLVKFGESWSAKLASLRREASLVQREIAESRLKALELYALDRIAEAWWKRVLEVPKGRWSTATVRKCRPAKTNGWSSVSAIIVDDGRGGSCSQTVARSELHWDEFRSVDLITWGPPKNSLFLGEAARSHRASSPFEVYNTLQAKLRETDADLVLLVPAGYLLKYEVGSLIDQVASGSRTGVTCLGSHLLGLPPDPVPSGLPDLADWFFGLRDPGPLLIRAESLSNLLGPATCLSLWSWYLVSRCMVDGDVEFLPFCHSIRTVPLEAANVSKTYADWIRATDPVAARDLPSAENQWDRARFDIVAAASAELNGWAEPLLAEAMTRIAKQQAKKK